MARTWLGGIAVVTLFALAQSASAQTHGRNNSEVHPVMSAPAAMSPPEPAPVRAPVARHYRSCWRHHHHYYDHHCPAPHHHH